MKKIFISTSTFGKDDPKPLDLLKNHGIDYELNPTGRQLTEAEIAGYLADKAGLIAGTEPLTEKVMEQVGFLKVISRLGVGLDSVDVAAAEKKGIQVYNTPNGPTEAVAELALGLILDVLRLISYSDRNLRRGAWKKTMGRLLKEKKVGIIGFGRIGRRLAELLTPFHCQLYIYDPYVSGNQGIKQVQTIEELIATSEIISLHIPYTKENHHLLGRKQLEAMKPGTVLINVSRGKLVDEAALYDCLQNGRLAGAGFDAFAAEPYSGALCELDNIVLTPHMGSYAKEARVQMEVDAVKNLLKGLGL
ncbi:MAG: phosphoglycerate dehydrogenase [Candidatus Margulisbacteria bacterium]|nr:phosphoglycerate dehydrogenase [Candidatus Margulisiibacteriota bacterium]MBU1617106.1 phosphoglycerate dehydrogenase [Candidatus Margulisiibacteriota bacterium]